MIRYERPVEPADFVSQAILKQEKKARAAIGGDGRVKDENAWRKLKFDSHWGAHKDVFNLAQYQKCGYCERKYTGYGDVEHFKPKKEVVWLDDPGKESGAGRVKGRSERDLVVPGYWWLAYHWKNYLFVCSHCNSKWKRNYIAVSPPHSPADVPREGRPETFLLLHPYEQDPEEHLQVEEDGFMWARTSVGRESIDVYGLNRPSLIPLRRDAYRSLRSTARAVIADLTPPEELVEALHPCFEYAAARRSGAAAGIGGADPMSIVMGLVAESLTLKPSPCAPPDFD